MNQWGEREAVHKAVVMALNTLRSLEILKGARNSTVQRRGARIDVPSQLIPWISHALLLTRDSESIDIGGLASAPELFGLNPNHGLADSRYPFLKIHSEGGNRMVFAVER